MTNSQDWGQPGQYPQDGPGQPWPQDAPWGPQRYDPAAHRQRLGQPPQQQQYPPQGQPWPQPGYQAPQGAPGWQQPGYGRQYPQGQPQQPDVWAQPAWQEPGQDRHPQPHRRKRSRVPLYAGIAAAIVIAGGTAYALAGHGTAKPLTCAQQYQQWKSGPADAIAKRTFGPDDKALNAAANSDDIPAMNSALGKLGSDAEQLEAYPMPACADPAGYWTQMLADLKAAGDNASATSGLGGLMTAMAPMEKIKPLNTELTAELARTAGVKS